jgi:hypothetical protein
MQVGGSAPGREDDRGGAAESLLQQELQDLRSIFVHADHLRWVTRGAAAKDFDALVFRFSENWRRWSEPVASCLIGVPPDGRVSSLTDASYRAWLADDWIESSEADRWILRELGVLAEWAHVRKEDAEPVAVAQLFEIIEAGVAQERTEFQAWTEGREHLSGCAGASASSSSSETEA